MTVGPWTGNDSSKTIKVVIAVHNPRGVHMLSGTRFLMVVLSASLVMTPAAADEPSAGETAPLPALEQGLEDVRQALGIPGMAAAVVRDGQLVWAQGFGYADVENKIEARPDTPFGLASVTKPIAATLVMMLVEEGAIDLDAPVSSYGVAVPDGADVTVRHLLTHTSEGRPGTVHRYDGNRYGYLGGVIEGATGGTFANLLSQRVLKPLEMMDTALNPLSRWGDKPTWHGFEDFTRTLGVGGSFGHYPDVYSRLSQPYQLDGEYEPIPGMYHLYHNPAAGLVSSVNDLAKFDIALDTGVLLGSDALTEMLSPAVPTVRGRSDLAYGLGWYVQDFDGNRFLWHAGRWPPSTSALYVKIPAYRLTFIVLANTDNLSVPFPGLGDGDMTHSTPALTFFRHFLFPREHGYELPQIDWSAGSSELQSQLAAVDDPASLEFLERELWSFRQAFASSGQHEQAQTLMEVGTSAFPNSSRRFDPSFTQTAAKSAFVAPITSARSLVVVSRLVVAWLAVVVASLVWMIAMLIRSPTTALWDWALWVAAAALLGPFAPAIYQFTRNASRPGSRDAGRQTACASLFCITGYAVAWIAAILILVAAGDDPGPIEVLGATLLIPLGVGLLAVRAPTLHKAAAEPYWSAARRGLTTELITLSVGVAVLFPLTLYVDNRWLSTIPHPTSPHFWGMMSVFSVIGLAAFVPLHLLMYRRGFSIWPAAATVRERPRAATLNLPTIRDAWWLLLISVVVMVTTIGLAASTFT